MERLFRGVSITDVPPSPRPRLGDWSGARVLGVLRELRAGQTQKVNVLVEKMWGVWADCSTGVNCIM